MHIPFTTFSTRVLLMHSNALPLLQYKRNPSKSLVASAWITNQTALALLGVPGLLLQGAQVCGNEESFRKEASIQLFATIENVATDMYAGRPWKRWARSLCGPPPAKTIGYGD